MNGASRKPVWRVKPKARARARALRRELTKAERVIWYAIRAHRLNGAGFRRQTPIGPYIVDFVSHSRKLIIEIDGAQHYETQQRKRDERRDAFLIAKGYRILRFNNNDVISNRYGVLTLIAEVLESAPSLPSPACGGGGPEPMASRESYGVVRGAAAMKLILPWSEERRP